MKLGLNSNAELIRVHPHSNKLPAARHFASVTLTGLTLSFTPLSVLADPTQEAYLKSGHTEVEGYFGQSVAVSGDTVVVGTYEAEDRAGDPRAIDVFVRNGTTWTRQASFTASNTGASDKFGIAVAISGDTLVVGAPLEDSSATGVNGDDTDNSAPASGAAYVFVRNGTNWTQQAYLKASNATEAHEFGGFVAISGDTIVIGALGEDSSATGVNGDESDHGAPGSGAAYVFVRNGTSWAQQAYLKASNTESDDHFGSTVDVSGDTIVVGAGEEDSSATGVNGDEADNSAPESGAAYVFVRNGTAWVQQAYLKASNTAEGDWFGWSVAVSGDTVVAGANGEDSSATGVNGDETDDGAPDSGATYVFHRSGATWTQQAYLKASNTAEGDGFGYLVDVSEDLLVSSAWSEDSSAGGVNGDETDDGAFDSGAAYVFRRAGAAWTQQAYLKASHPEAEDYFGTGTSVAVSGDIVVIGNWGDDSGASGVNGDATDNSATDSGAAYLFTGFIPTNLAPKALPPILLPAGPVELRFEEGTPGGRYRIQRSADLRDWTPLAAVDAQADGAFSVTDPDPPVDAAFYRAVSGAE